MDINKRKQIGTRINAALASANMKQKELAKAIGVTDNTISYFVSGSRVPNTEQIIEIAASLGVSTDYLLGVSDVQSTDTDLQAVCEYTGLSEKAARFLHEETKIFEGMVTIRPIEFSRSWTNTINKLIEDEADEWEKVKEDVEVDIDRTLLSTITDYYGMALTVPEKAIYISESGFIDTDINRFRENVICGTVFEVDASSIVEQYLRNAVNDALKKSCLSYNKARLKRWEQFLADQGTQESQGGE